MLIVTGEIALTGTARLAREKEKELRTYFHPSFVERAKKMDMGDVPARTAACLRGFSDRILEVPLENGGLLTGLWEIAKMTGRGLRVDMASVPIRQESVEICEYFALNPYGLYSGGAVLMEAKHPDEVLCALEKAQIPAGIIGYLQKKPDKILCWGEREGYLNRPAEDELYKILPAKDWES